MCVASVGKDPLDGLQVPVETYAVIVINAIAVIVIQPIGHRYIPVSLFREFDEFLDVRLEFWVVCIVRVHARQDAQLPESAFFHVGVQVWTFTPIPPWEYNVSRMNFMPQLFAIILWLVVLGLILWVVNELPIDAAIKKIIRVIVIVVVLLWLLSILIGYAPLPPIYAPRR